MFDTVVVATDGSASGERAVDVALDLADRSDAAVHALYVVDRSRVEGLLERLHGEVEDAVAEQSEEASDAVEAHTGTRGRDGEHSFLLGSVAERVVRTCPVPVLTVRQLEAGG